MAGSKYPNIAASAFHRGEYVGYGGGTWRISKHGKGATAWIAVQQHGGGGRFTARSLAEISKRLAIKAESNPRRKSRKVTRARKNPRKRTRYAISRAEAEKRIRNRYEEQALAFPTMRKDIPYKLYRKRNIGHVRKKGLFASYAKRNPYRAYIVYAGEKSRSRGGKVRKWYWNGSALTLQKRFAETFPNATTAHNVGKRIRGRILNSTLRNRFSCVGITSAV